MPSPIQDIKSIVDIWCHVCDLDLKGWSEQIRGPLDEEIGRWFRHYAFKRDPLNPKLASWIILELQNLGGSQALEKKYRAAADLAFMLEYVLEQQGYQVIY